MPVEFKRTPSELGLDLETIAREAGFTRLDRFIGALIDAIRDTFSEAYDSISTFDAQTRIDTASGAYLDSWGILHNEDRNGISRAESLELDNVFIQTKDGSRVTDFTVGSVPISIPAGTSALDENGNVIFSTLDSVILTDTAFTRVVGIVGIDGQISPGSYTLDGSIQDFVLGRNPGIVGQSDLILADTELVAVVKRPILTTSPVLSEEDFRSILYSKSRSYNLANREKINLLLTDPDIARFVIEEFSSGSSSLNVFLEPTRTILDQGLEITTRSRLQELLPYGTFSRIGRMIMSRMELDFRISLIETTNPNNIPDIIQEIRNTLISNISAIGSGNNIDFTTIIQIVEGIVDIGDSFLDTIRINGRSILANNYQMKNIEKVFVTENSITIDVI